MLKRFFILAAALLTSACQLSAPPATEQAAAPLRIAA